MTTTKPEVAPAIYQLKVTLLGARPPIWRRVLVPAEFTLARLHDVLQAAIGWEDSHLHEFRIGRQRFGIPDPDDRLMGLPSCIHERKTRLGDVLTKAGAKAEYTYDFGDSWEHSIVLEKILTPEAGQTYPLCAAGERHGPPEDCGGIGGFYNLLEALADPDHPEHAELQEWIGDSFDPESFSVADVNQRLQQIFHRPPKTAAKRRPPK